MVGSVCLLVYREAGWMQRAPGLDSEVRVLVPACPQLLITDVNFLAHCEEKTFFFFTFLERKLQKTNYFLGEL